MTNFAHRGVLKLFPENSMQSLIKSIELGFGIETDLRLTRDGDFILIHDDNFKRLTGTDIDVASVTLTQGMTMNYRNTNTSIPSLRQFLDYVSLANFKKQIAIHLKADSQTEIGLQKLLEYWEEYDLFEKAFVFDLTVENATRLKKLNPKIKIALIISEYKFEPTVYKWEDVKHLSIFDIVWAAEYRKFYSETLISDARKTKEKIYAMSPDVHGVIGHPLAKAGYQDTWRDLLSWNIDGICTDNPIELQELINKYQ